MRNVPLYLEKEGFQSEGVMKESLSNAWMGIGEIEALGAERNDNGADLSPRLVTIETCLFALCVALHVVLHLLPLCQLQQTRCVGFPLYLHLSNTLTEKH